MARDNDANGSRQRARQAREARRTSSAGEYEFTTDTLIELGAVVAVVSEMGGAVRIGRTRDGGALAVGMYLGDDYATEYIRPAEDVGLACEEIVSAWCPSHVERYVEWREHLYTALKSDKGTK